MINNLPLVFQVAGAGFANLVMKASAQLWEDKFMAMRAKKGGNEVSDAVLLI